MRAKFYILALFFWASYAVAGCDDKAIKELVSETSKQLPMRMDDYTTLVSVGCYADMLMYKYDVKDGDTDDTKYSKFDANETAKFSHEQQIVMSNLYCTDPDVLELHRFIKGIKYLYVLQNGKPFLDIVVRSSDCARIIDNKPKF